MLRGKVRNSNRISRTIQNIRNTTIDGYPLTRIIADTLGFLMLAAFGFVAYWAAWIFYPELF